MAEWLILDKTTGIGSDEVTITCGSYEEMEDRLRNLVFTTVNGRASDTCKVTQKGRAYYLYVNPSSVSMDYTGGTRTITINTNDDWILSGHPEWVTTDKDSGASGMTTVTLTLTANTGGSARAGTMTVEGEHVAKTVSIYQRSESQGDVAIDPDHIDADGCEDGEYTVRIATDKCWSFDPGDVPTPTGDYPIYGIAATPVKINEIYCIFNLLQENNNVYAERQGNNGWYITDNTLDINIINTLNVGEVVQSPSIGATDVVIDFTKFKNKVNLTSCSAMVSYPDCKKIKFIGIDTSNVKFMDGMFSYCSGLTSLDLSNLNTSNVTTMESMFLRCSGLTSLDLSNFDTSNVTDMNNMFNSCRKLTGLDLSNFNTSNVTDMTFMFYNCSGLTSLDLSNFNTSKVKTMSNMFSYCSSLTTLDLSNFDTSNVNNEIFMFWRCTSLTSLDLSSFDTSKWSSMYYMFGDCSSLTTLDLSNFDTSNMTSMYRTFYNCSSLTNLDLSNFNTPKLNDMYEIFNGCGSLVSLNLSNFNTEKVTDMSWAFAGCASLTTVMVTNCSNATQQKILTQLRRDLKTYTWTLSNGIITRS